MLDLIDSCPSDHHGEGWSLDAEIEVHGPAILIVHPLVEKVVDLEGRDHVKAAIGRFALEAFKGLCLSEINRLGHWQPTQNQGLRRRCLSRTVPNTFYMEAKTLVSV